MTDVHPRVQGECPACNLTSLFLGEGGYVTCSNLECPMPDTMLAFKVKETGLPFYRRGDKLPTGEEFIGYSGDGSPMWNELAGASGGVVITEPMRLYMAGKITSAEYFRMVRELVSARRTQRANNPSAEG